MNRLELADGRLLAYRERGEGRPLVLLHGWAMSSAVFSEALEFFSPDFRVLAPDLRGHGQSSPGEGYGLQDLAADLQEWFHAMGLTEAALLGWSLGGQVAMKLYRRSGAQIGRLVLVGTTPRFASGADWRHGLPAGQVRAMGRNLSRDYLRAMEEFFNLQFEGEDLSAGRLRQIAEMSGRGRLLPDLQVALAALETLRSADQRSGLSAVDCPALVFHGGLDRIVPVGAGRYLAQELPDAHLAIDERRGHAPFLSNPEESFALWREFLQ